MVDIHHEGLCAAPLDVTFGYVDDYRNTTTWMFGLACFEPEGEGDHGLGAVFAATFRVRPVSLHSSVQVTAWERDSLICFTSITGFTNSSMWRFAAVGPEVTKVTVRFSYELPGGLAGRALGRALEPIAALSVRHSDAALRANVHAAHTNRL